MISILPTTLSLVGALVPYTSALNVGSVLSFAKKHLLLLVRINDPRCNLLDRNH